MGQLLLLLVVALTVAAVVFGVAVLLTGGDPGLVPVEPDGRAIPLPGTRPLQEGDVTGVRFDTAVRGYRMAQVDQAMRRAAYDIGYKEELIGVLESEVTALREGRVGDADALRDARVAALAAARPATEPADQPTPAEPADQPTPAESADQPTPAESAGQPESAGGADRSAADPAAEDGDAPVARDTEPLPVVAGEPAPDRAVPAGEEPADRRPASPEPAVGGGEPRGDAVRSERA